MNSARDPLRCEQEEGLRFEALLIDLSARFVNVPADQVDGEIEDAQRRICECLGLDTALLWQWTDQPAAPLKLTHIHRPLGGPPVPAQAEAPAVLPWAYARLTAGRMYVHSTLDELPREAAVDRATFERHGVKSHVGLPLAVGGGAPFGALTFNTTREHRVWTEAIVSRLQLVAQVFANALARKRADAEARLRLRQLAHLNRVATMGELATALAHELNQPLGAILRNAEVAELLLQDPAPDLDELRAIVAEIKRDDQRAGGVIDRLRALLRQRSIELRPAALPGLVDEVVALALADAAGRGIRIVSAVPDDLPAARCDRVHVQQVLLNLIVNAMDAIGEAGAAEPRITIGARDAGDGQVELWVSDTGRGIEPQDLASVFEPFYTTKPGGMGLGLAISRTLVEAHGGRLWVGRAGGQVGRGASLHFSLPAAAAAEGSP
jgi:signal transduction histidine kinase